MSIYMPSNIIIIIIIKKVKIIVTLSIKNTAYYDEAVMQTIRLADVQLQTLRKYIVCKPIRLHKSFLLKHNNK